MRLYTKITTIIKMRKCDSKMYFVFENMHDKLAKYKSAIINH